MTDAAEVELRNLPAFEREKVKICVDFRLADFVRRDLDTELGMAVSRQNGGLFWVLARSGIWPISWPASR